MRSSKALARLHTAYLFRNYRLLNLADEAFLDLTQPRARRAVGYVCIEAMNGWELFARSYFVSCASGCKSLTGQRISSHLSGLTHEDILRNANAAVPRNLRGMRGVNWKKLPALDHLGTTFGLTNQFQISVLVSSPSSTLGDLNLCRVFFAHKSLGNLTSALDVHRSYGIPSMPSIYELLKVKEPTSGQALLTKWLSDLVSFADDLCK